MRHFTGSPKGAFSFDLHVLGTPPAFVLSQDQTLQFIFLKFCPILFNYLEPLQALSNICYLVFKDQISVCRPEATSKESMRNNPGKSNSFLTFFRIQIFRSEDSRFKRSELIARLDAFVKNFYAIKIKLFQKKKPLLNEGAFQIISAATYFPTPSPVQYHWRGRT